MKESHIILLILTAFVLVGCNQADLSYGNQDFNRLKDLNMCADGTLNNECSVSQPFYCLNGSFINNSEECGCSVDSFAENNTCFLLTCNDGTNYSSCSEIKPFFCNKGKLVSRSAECGCPKDMIPTNDSCKSKYYVGAKKIELKYILRSVKDSINITTYKGISESLPKISRYNCNPYPCYIGLDFQVKFLNNDRQNELLDKLVKEIQAKTDNEDDQARIAISLVQNIPYDYAKEGINGGDFDERYPYQVLHDHKGLCGEKSKLLVYLLKELGFGVAFLSYEDVLHQVVGIKCPVEYSVFETGYCFIEPTQSEIVTNNKIDYKGISLEYSKPSVLIMNEGYSFDSAKEEFNDAKEWNRIQDIISYPGQRVSNSVYRSWLALVQKYCIPTTGMECKMS